MRGFRHQNDRARVARIFRPITSKGLYQVLAAILVMGCMYGSLQACSLSAPASRIIVQFADTSSSPPENIKVQIPDGAITTLHRERAMSGEVDLYKGCVAKKRLAAVIHALIQRTDVRYAEADRKLGY